MLVTQTAHCTRDGDSQEETLRERELEDLSENHTEAKMQQCCNDALIDAPQQPTVQESDIECDDAPPVAPVLQPEAKTKTEKEFGAAKIIKITKKKKTNQIQNGGEENCQISEQLKAKLEELSIPLDKKVRNAIASHDISQAYGAVVHIENTKESISNPRGVFLFQINKQPVEPMGSRVREYKASDFSGYTLEHIKSMYPNSWREAARHFGLFVEEEQR